MNLIYITSAKIPTTKANGLQIMKVCEAFAQSGIRTELIIPFRFNFIKDDPFSYYGVKRIFVIKKVWSLDLFGWKWIPGRLSFYIHSLIFTIGSVLYALFRGGGKQNIYYSRNYLPLFFLCLFGFNPVAEIHDYRSYKPKWPIRFILRMARRIVVNSEGTLQALQNHYRISLGKVLVAPNGVDLDFFGVKEDRAEARRLLGIPEDKFIFSYVGRLETAGTEKGVPDLLKAFALLSKEKGDCLLYIIGGPPLMVEKYKESLGPWGLSPDLVRFTGYVEYKKIPLYLRAVDVVVVPLPKTRHSFTTSPIKIFEFMAAGKTIIVSNLPSVRACLNEINALFFEPEDSNDLAQKLNFAIENMEKMKELSNQAFIDSRKYSWFSRAQKIFKFIQQ